MAVLERESLCMGAGLNAGQTERLIELVAGNEVIRTREKEQDRLDATGAQMV
jgi:hypothetical protein